MIFTTRADRRAFRIEEELADSIDLMVSSLRSGVGMMDALESSVAESRGRFRDLLEDVIARIRFGEAPAAAIATMGERVPLESFWLFSMTQRVHWEVGGAVARNLAAVGIFVRDRLEMRRLILAQSTQARISMLFVALLTYIIGALVWYSNPPRMEEFVSSRIGLIPHLRGGHASGHRGLLDHPSESDGDLSAPLAADRSGGPLRPWSPSVSSSWC